MAMDDADHDVLITLRSELVGVRQTIEAHNIASVQRDTRIETKVDRINGTVKRHDIELITHAQVPHSAVDQDTARVLVARTNEMWTAWSIGKWVGLAGVLALLGQTAALLTLALRVR